MGDPLSGGGPLDIATISISESQIVVGGMNAEHGNAQSGIINIVTQEGGPRFEGEATWMTDDFGAPDKTFNNFDRITFGFGGPTPFKDLTYFATYEGSFSDTYLRSSLTKPSTTLLDFLQFGNRQRNEINTNFKLAYRASPRHKITFETGLERAHNAEDYTRLCGRA